MRVDRLARLFEQRYDLIAEAESPHQVVLDIKKELQNAVRNHVMGKDQTIKWWAEQGYQLAKDFVATMVNLSDSKNTDLYDPTKMFLLINQALYLSTQMKHNPSERVRAFRDKLVDAPENKGQFNKRLDAELNLRISKLGTALSNLDSILSKAAKKLQVAWPDLRQFPLQGHYEEQERRRISPKEISQFVKFHPATMRYGLDEVMLGKLLMSDGLMYFPQEREELTTLINAVNRGHTPHNADDILRKIQKIREELSIKRPETVHNLPEEVAQEAFKSEVLNPSQQWSQQMQQRKQELGVERVEQEEADRNRERLAPLVEQRDKEHEQKKNEQNLLNKYNNLTFDRWMRR